MNEDEYIDNVYELFLSNKMKVNLVECILSNINETSTPLSVVIAVFICTQGLRNNLCRKGLFNKVKNYYINNNLKTKEEIDELFDNLI